MTFIVKYLLFYNFFFGVANIANLSIINFVNNNVVWMHQNQLRWKINTKKLKIFLKCSAAFICCIHDNLNRKWCWCAMHFWALSMQLILIFQFTDFFLDKSKFCCGLEWNQFIRNFEITLNIRRNLYYFHFISNLLISNGIVIS